MTAATRPILGVDLGGTTTKIGLVEGSGRVAVKTEFDTLPREGVDSWVRRLAAEAARLGHFEAAGVAVPGVLDRVRGAVVQSPNLTAWNGYALADALCTALGVPIVLENDANAAAVGEARCGAPPRRRDFLLTTLGTGVGGGIVLAGELYIGPGGMAGEVGHVLAEPGGRPCGCGNRGCVETVASVQGMTETAAEAARSAGPAGGLGLAAWLDSESPGQRAAARAALDRAGSALGLAFAQAVILFDLRCFLVGGGGAALLPALLPVLRDSLAAHVYGRPVASIEVAPATLGNDAGLLGAASLAGRRLFP